MEKRKRRVFGVITADAAEAKQREMLSGILEKAQQCNVDIVVCSDICSWMETLSVSEQENGIHAPIASACFDGWILISDSILHEQLQQQILSCLHSRPEIPVVVLGTLPHNASFPAYRVLNTSDENDLFDVTNHLIAVHGCTEIDILLGADRIATSHPCVAGYRRALEQHGIPFDESRVHIARLQENLGRAFAKECMNGVRADPQAVICCNDDMAYGLLDAWMEQGIAMTENMAMICYDTTWECHAHMPRLATYQRNRKALGGAAVCCLLGALPEPFTPPRGRLIVGETCGCHAQLDDMRHEMTFLQTQAPPALWYQMCQLERRLTECRNMNEFVACCRALPFVMRHAAQLYLCLFENWYDDHSNGENMVRYHLLTDEEPTIFQQNDFAAWISGDAALYYLCPLVFSDCVLGYIVLRSDTVDSFSHMFCSWLKSIANGLGMLRMKSEIRYLVACQTHSAQHDALTAMWNENGMRTAYNSAEPDSRCMVALQICLFDVDAFADSATETVHAILDAAEAVRQFCGEQGVPARLRRNTFLCMVQCCEDADFLIGLLTAILWQHKVYMARYGMDSFACTAQPCDDAPFDVQMHACMEALQTEITRISIRRRDKNYLQMLALRNEIYCNPNATFDSDQLRGQFDGSAGHLRNVYKGCFGVSFHQDCIAARVAKAKFLLALSDLQIQEVAYQCGYADHKYFMRQFVQETGMTAKQFQTAARKW